MTVLSVLWFLLSTTMAVHAQPLRNKQGLGHNFAAAATKNSRVNAKRRLNDENQIVTKQFSDVSYPAIGSATVMDGSNVVYELDVVDKSGSKITFILHDKEEAQEFAESDGLADFEVHENMISAPLQNQQQEEEEVMTAVPNFPCYRNLSTTFEFMDEMAANYPNLATVLDIGDSYLKLTSGGQEGYDILVLKLTNNNIGTQNKAKFFAMFGLHAREMAPPELGMRFAEMLVEGYGQDADTTTLLDYTEVHLLLQANPDGRFVAETKQELYHRKNMHPSSRDTCSEGRLGVDLNRNFPFKWGNDEGSSNNPCSQTYRGENPGSEPEVRAVVDHVSSLFPVEQRGSDLNVAFPDTNMGIFMDVHAYGGLNIYPWNFKEEKSANDEQLKALAIKFQHFNGHALSGPEQPDFLYIVSGGSSDWAHGELGVAGGSLEIGSEFYQKCNEFEESIVPGNLPVLMYGASVARAPYTMALGPDILDISMSSEAIPNDISAFLSISVEASDSAYSDGTTAQQGVSDIMLYIDKYPYDTSAPPGIPLNVGFALGQSATSTLNLTGSELLTQMTNPFVGKHTLYFQAIDNLNYAGPVLSVFLQVCDTSDTVCLAGYNPPIQQPCDPATLNNTLTVISIGQTYSVPCVDLLLDVNKYLCDSPNAKVLCECSCLDQNTLACC